MTNASVKLRAIFNDLIDAFDEQGYEVNCSGNIHNVFYRGLPVMGMSCGNSDIRLNVNHDESVKALNDDDITFVGVQDTQELITKALGMAKAKMEELLK